MNVASIFPSACHWQVFLVISTQLENESLQAFCDRFIVMDDCSSQRVLLVLSLTVVKECKGSRLRCVVNPSINVCSVISSSLVASAFMSNILTCAPTGPLSVAENVTQMALLYCLITLYVISVWRHQPHAICILLSGVLRSGEAREIRPRVCRLITLKYRVCFISGGITMRSYASVICFVNSSSRYFLWHASLRTVCSVCTTRWGRVCPECGELGTMRKA